ncbi:2Fe-2S iron-sulfur cluster-binding protein [Methylopila sp. 73B]|uniref:FAD-dependent oxidoreductase n=1 Tax=Methylopila sp. 73B TaxID=1120792 RepID=UPI0003A0EBA8|nr:2Fe-2S iron-sulfur cluster-binding protein [Methylopila sp. 73B]
MSGPHRLPEMASARFGAAVDRTEPIGFRLDGRPRAGLYGDTLASALLASGRTVFGRSALLGRPRGLTALGFDDAVAWAAAEGERDLRPADELLLSEGATFRTSAGLSAGSPLGLGARAALGPESRLPSLGRRLFERVSRQAALPIAATRELPPRMAARFESCDVLVIGAGLAGLAAAKAARSAGLHVRVAEASLRAGGLADLYDGTIDGLPPAAWVAQTAGDLVDGGALWLGTRAVQVDRSGSVHLLERVRGQLGLLRVAAQLVVVASGWRERPLPFADNDRPGVMLATTARALLRRHAVAPGVRVVVATTGDEGYRTAVDLKDAGVEVEMILDARDDPQGPAVDVAKAAGVSMSFASVVTGVETDKSGERLKAVRAANREGAGLDGGLGARTLFADALVVSGGLAARSELGEAGDRVIVVGSGFNARDALAGGAAAGAEAAQRLEVGLAAAPPVAEIPADEPDGGLDLYMAGLDAQAARTAFVDFGADVTVADVAEAAAMGVDGPQVMARWLGLGRGPDGGAAAAGLPQAAFGRIHGEAPSPAGEVQGPRWTLAALAAAASVDPY